MKKFINIVSAGAAALLALSSCFDDKGNYDYEEVIPVSIDMAVGNNGFLSIKFSEQLIIDPLLTFGGKTMNASQTGDTFSFIWYCNNVEIASGPVLDYPVKDLSGARPYIKLKVITNRDESTFLAGLTIDLIAEYQTGWVILTKKDGKSYLSYINPDTYEVYADFYTQLAGEELGPDAQLIEEHWSFSGLTATGNIQVVMSNPEGNIDLNGQDLTPMYYTNSYFIGNEPPAGFLPANEIYLWNFSYLLDTDGNLYLRKYATPALLQSGVYASTPIHIPGGVKIDRAWSGGLRPNVAIFYDKDNGALYYGSGSNGAVIPLRITGWMGPPLAPGAYTDPADMDKELVYVAYIAAGGMGGGGMFYALVYKAPDGSYHRQRIMLSDQGGYAVQVMVDSGANPDFQFAGSGIAHDASVFLQSFRTADHLFFSGGSDNRSLYLFEHTAKRTSLYYTFESPIRTISQNHINSAHTLLMVGLENGEFHFIGIAYDDIVAADPATRFRKKVEPGQGVPVSTLYKNGFGYTQM